ncbi:hypothetical protein [Macrococcus animalis]|uniref:hypothetical protein n=1 Tax=Macrococcus animalis TaxID=3395467 RepID=UPI0039BE7FBB
MNELQSVEHLTKELERALKSEKYTLKQLKYKEEELIIMKKKLRLYENRWNKIMEFLPIKILMIIKNKLKG